MIVVSNTTPLHYLVLIDAADILEKLYQRVIVPQSVIVELQQDNTPEKVRDWINVLPAWADVRSAINIDDELKLGAGEKEAIALAEELNADFLILDDRKARREATARGLTVTGTLNILELGDRRGFLDLPQAVAALKLTSFRVSEDLLNEMLERHRRSKESN